MAQILSELKLQPESSGSLLSQVKACITAPPDAQSNDVRMLLAKLKVLQQARLRAEAEALAAAAAVDMAIPQSVSRPTIGAMVKQGSSNKIRDNSYHMEACSAANHVKQGGDSGSDGDGYPEVESSAEGAVPELLTDFDVDNEWCDKFIGESDENGHPNVWENSSNSVAAMTAAVVAAENRRREINRLCTPESKRMRVSSDWDSGIESGFFPEESAGKYGHGSGSVSKGKKPRQKRGTATDPQSMAARARREKIASKVRHLQSLVPGTEKLDTASMLEQAIIYVRELQTIVEQQAKNENEGSEKSS